MSTIINASTSAGLLITPDNSGVLQLQQNGVNLPALSVAPAFSASLAGSQTISAGVLTKLLFDTEEYDTNNNFASSRFTPTVPGYYMLNWSIYSPTTSVNQNLNIYKNGSLYKQTNYMPGSTQWLMWTGSLLVYLNGSTDYVELYIGMQTGGVIGNNAGVTFNWFQGFLARGV